MIYRVSQKNMALLIVAAGYCSIFFGKPCIEPPLEQLKNFQEIGICILLFQELELYLCWNWTKFWYPGLMIFSCHHGRKHMKACYLKTSVSLINKDKTDWSKKYQPYLTWATLGQDELGSLHQVHRKIVCYQVVMKNLFC